MTEENLSENNENREIQNPPKEEPNNSEVSKNESEKNISVLKEQRGQKRSLEDNTDISDLPQELKDMFKPLKCELCNVTATSPVVAYTHYKGKTHVKNVNAHMKKHFNNVSAFKLKKTYFEPIICKVCNIEVTSNIDYQQHLAGKQHQKNLRKNKDELITSVTKTEIDPTGRFGIGKSFIKEIEQPSQLTAIQTPLFCEICTVYTNTPQQMAFHKQGQKHSKNVAKMKQNCSALTKDGYYNEEDVWQPSPKLNENT